MNLGPSLFVKDSAFFFRGRLVPVWHSHLLPLNLFTCGMFRTGVYLSICRPSHNSFETWLLAWHLESSDSDSEHKLILKTSNVSSVYPFQSRMMPKRISELSHSVLFMLYAAFQLSFFLFFFCNQGCKCMCQFWNELFTTVNRIFIVSVIGHGWLDAIIFMYVAELRDQLTQQTRLQRFMLFCFCMISKRH